MRAPLDWDKPDGDTMGIALIRARSTAEAGERIGSLLFNFGGPGASGITILPAAADDYENLRNRYDLVSFDPRGVGASSGVRCLDAEAMEETLQQDDTPDDGKDEVEAVLELRQAYVEACEKNSGRVLPHVTTADAARDMDLMRRLLGDEKLYYFGISYGTELGGVYAHLFPRNVGRAVLDGVVDPTKNQIERALAQAKGFQLAFDHFAAWCVRQGCSLGDSAEQVEERVVQLEAELDDRPLPVDQDRRLTGSLLVLGVSAALYSETAWPALAAGLEAAAEGDGTTMLKLAGMLSGQRIQAESDLQDANTAITCADRSDRYTLADALDRTDVFEAASPVFGESSLWETTMQCLGWPVPGKAAHPEVSAAGAPPILLIGNTGDPATPYEGAARMAEALGKGVGVELTYQGEGHGAYDSRNTCVRNAVDTYLLNGELPAPGTVCAHEPLQGK